MNGLIDYVDAGGVWAWLALIVGAFGVLSALLGLTKRYKQPSAIFAMEMGMVAFALGGLGWYLNDRTADERRQMAHETLGASPGAGAARSSTADAITAQIEADAAASVMRPVHVALRAGGAAIVFGAALFMIAGPASRRRGARR